MANDLVTRLLLNSSNFDNNIKKSSQEVRELQKIGSTVSASIKSSFAAMAGAAGLAMGGMEAFNKTIESSQALTDSFGTIVEQAKSSVNTFFNSLSMGDFSNFNNQMDLAIDKAAKFYAEIDKLASMDLFQDNKSTEIRIKMQQQKNIITNKNSTSEQKKAAKNQLNALDKELLTSTNDYAKQANRAYSAALQRLVAEQGGNMSGADVLKTFDKFSSYDEAVKKYNELEKKRIKAQSKIETAQTSNYGAAMQYTKTVDTKESLKIKNSQLYKNLKAIAQAGDKTVQEAKSYQTKALNAQMQAVSQVGSNLRKEGAKITTNSGAGKDKELSPKQSIAYYQQELTKANKEFNNAVSDSARVAIQKKINQLMEVIQVMNFNASHPNLPTNLKGENGSMSGHTSLKVSANPGAGLNVQPIYTKADVKINNEYADSLNGIAQIMGNIQGATNGAASSWLNYATNIMSGVAGMVTAIMALSAANETEQKSATGAAGAEAIKSAASTPFVGWLMVGAAAASVISAFASLPKFANGGVLGGNSYFGDKLLFAGNSGEMILNAGQQANLFNMLNNGNNTTTSKVGKVEFEIRADKLYGLLKNYQLMQNKLR